MNIMAQFLKLTLVTENNTSILVSVDQINVVEPCAHGSEIIIGSAFRTVKETPAEIEEMIRHAFNVRNTLSVVSMEDIKSLKAKAA
jgi:hypothetical protein